MRNGVTCVYNKHLLTACISLWPVLVPLMPVAWSMLAAPDLIVSAAVISSVRWLVNACQGQRNALLSSWGVLAVVRLYHQMGVLAR
jgi:hypothetical protein